MDLLAFFGSIADPVDDFVALKFCLELDGKPNNNFDEFSCQCTTTQFQENSLEFFCKYCKVVMKS